MLCEIWALATPKRFSVSMVTHLGTRIKKSLPVLLHSISPSTHFIPLFHVIYEDERYDRPLMSKTCRKGWGTCGSKEDKGGWGEN